MQIVRPPGSAQLLHILCIPIDGSQGRAQLVGKVVHKLLVFVSAAAANSVTLLSISSAIWLKLRAICPIHPHHELVGGPVIPVRYFLGQTGYLRERKNKTL